MPISVFIQSSNGFINKTSEYGLNETTGWWNCITKGDINDDGNSDYLLGNLGWNYKYQTGGDKGFHVYADDFDQNGSFDIALGYFNDSNLFPVRGRQCSSEQCPMIKKKFPTYDAFAKATLKDVYGERLNSALHYEINTFDSSVLLNNGNGNFELMKMPSEAQIFPVQGIASVDVDKDGKDEYILGGNLFVSEIETGRADAGVGLVLDVKEGKMTSITSHDTGLIIDKDVRNVKVINMNNGRKALLVANNDDRIQLFGIIPKAINKDI
jgi:hypothetical protein